MASDAIRDRNDTITVSSEDGEIVELMSTREDLQETYSTLRDGIPENWTLPFSADMISMWDVVQHTRALHLYPYVSTVFDHLGVVQLSLAAQEHQTAWIEHMLDILAKYRILGDTTPLGGGKTYMHCLLAQMLQTPMLVICPANVIPVWEVMRVTVPSLTVLSYDKLRSKRKGVDGTRELKHGLLHRTDTTETYTKDNGEKVEVHHCEFSATDKLVGMCASGLMVVIDEVQGIKNRSGQQRACREVIRTARSSPNAFVTLLSGSPFDKVEHVTNLMMSMGIIKDTMLIQSHFGKNVKYLGLQEMIYECKKIDPIMTNATIRAMPQAKARDDADKIVYKLYNRVIKPALVGGAPRPKIDYKQYVSNTSFVFSDEDAIRYAAALTDLRHAVNTDRDTGRVISVEFTTMASALARMEAYACPSVVKDATARLRRVQSSQVIIFCTYLETYKILEADFKKQGFRVSILNGEVSMQKRTEVIAAFQVGDIDVLVAGVKVGGVGLSLHDRRGGHSRFSYIFPTWEAIPMYQCTGRTYRPGTLSDTWIDFVYCAQFPAVKVIDAMHKKSKVIRKSLANPDAARIRLPGEFPEVKRIAGSERVIQG